MPSHLSDIGFHFNEDNFYDDLISMLDTNMKKSSREITYNGKTYLVVYIDNDIEFWLPVGENRTLDPMSFELHYNTHRWIDVINPKWVCSDDTENQGLLTLWDCNKNFPLNIYVPNAACVPELKEKAYKAQIVCFAESFVVFKNEEDFYAKYEGFSIRSFFPTGQFTVNNEEETARAWINGIVKKLDLKTNSYTKSKYYHLVIECYDTDFDVLLDEECVNEPIEINDILSVHGWLTGKLHQRYYGDDFGAIKRKKEGNSKLNTLNDLYTALYKAWSKDSAHPSCQSEWTPEDSSYGQCAITAMLFYDMFGGTIHKIRFSDGETHYFNKINGNYIDLTSAQFDLYNIPVNYEPNEEVDREYCGKNQDTLKRYKILIDAVSGQIN